MTNWQRLPDTRPQGAGMTERSGIYKWSGQRGEAVEGAFGGLQDGKYGKLAKIGTQLIPLKGYAPGGKVVDEFEKIPVGMLVRLEFLGTKQPKDLSKKPMNLFDIFTAGPTAAGTSSSTPSGATVPAANTATPTTVTAIEDALIAKLGIGPAQDLLNMLKRMGPSLGGYEDALKQVAVQHGILKDPDGTKF